MLPEQRLPEIACRPPLGLVVMEDHLMVRDGLVHLLNATPWLRVSGVAANRAELRLVLRDKEPDLLLMDLMIGGSDSLDLIEDLVRDHPGLRVLVISMMSESVYAERALRAGALGYVMKSATSEELLTAIGRVAEGRVYLSPRIFVGVFRNLVHKEDCAGFPGLEALSDREVQVFQLIGAGMPNRQMAPLLGISVKTIETHRENLKSKLGISDGHSLVSAAQDFVNRIMG